MKITLVSNNFHPLTGGGESERSFKMAEQLLKKGHEVSLIAMDDKLPDSRKNNLNFTYKIFLKTFLKRFRIPTSRFNEISAAVQWADLVHIMGHWSLLNAYCYLVCRKYQKPYFVTPAGSLVLFGRSLLLKRIFNFIIGYRILKNSTQVIIITENELPSLDQYGVDKSKITLIPNGVSEADFNPSESEKFRTAHNIGPKKYIFFIGRLNKIKGIDLLVESFLQISNKHPDYDLVIAGPDEGLKDDLIEKVKQAGQSTRFHFLPILVGSEKAAAFHQSEFVCIPSRKEAMSIVALEAGICKKTVLLTDQCGFDEIDKHRLGWMTTPSVAGLSQSLNTLLTNQKEYQDRGFKFYQFVKEKYEWSKITEIYVEAFKKAISQKK